MYPSGTGWWYNPTFWSILAAWIAAQSAKMLGYFLRTRRLDFGYLVSTGGMPSAHSALAAALCTSVAIREGSHSVLFAISLAFAAIVMFDAQSVRQAAGQQARVLNRLLDELFKTHRFSHERLVELLGHTRIEVFLGLLLGIAAALLVHAASAWRAG